MKKFGVLTYHHVINEGAVLQSYSIVQNLKKIKPHSEVQIVDYRPIGVELRYLMFILFSGRLKSIVHKVLHYFKLRHFINKELLLSKEKCWSNNYLKAVTFLQSLGYDGIIIGSDEVWKVGQSTMGRRFPNIYWPSKSIKCRKVSFAASGNRTPFKRLSLETLKIMKESLDDFKYISVRDQHTLDMVKYLDAGNMNKLEISPDPTFILDIPFIEIKEKLSKIGFNWKKPRAAIVISNQKVNFKICNLLKQKGYQVIGLSCYVNGADINLMGMIDVFEWANIFRYFDLCITDRFHATIFSIRHGIPFITIDNETHYQEYESKTSFLLHSAGLEEHHINMIRKGWGEFEERIERIKRTEETRKKLIQKFGELKDKCMNSFIKVVENL